MGRKKRIRKPQVLTRKWLDGICDELYSLKVRSARVCVACGKPTPIAGLQNMHGLSRTLPGTKYDPEKTFPGCVRCHARYSYGKGREEWTMWLMERWGVEKYQAMYRRGQQPKQWDLAAMIVALWADPETQDALTECSEGKQRRLEAADRKVQEPREEAP